MSGSDYRCRQLIEGGSAVPDTAFQTCNPRLEVGYVLEGEFELTIAGELYPQ